jgi:DNA repair protein RecO (recombination protein O)
MACDLQLYEGKNLDTVSQAEQIANYGATIVNDYSRYTVASTIVEAAEKLTRELSNEKHYLLVVGALRTLAQAEIEPTQILDSYLLRALSLSGWVPLLESCSQCGSEPSSFSMHTGSVTCSQCVAAGSVKIGRAGLEHMQSLMAGEWDKVTSQSLQIKQAVSSVVAGYMQWQLERGLRSLNFVERA